MMIAERIARVLTERFVVEYELNGAFGDVSVDHLVDEHWRAHMPLAREVLRAIRHPDPVVAAALAETGVWEDAIDGALAEAGEELREPA